MRRFYVYSPSVTWQKPDCVARCSPAYLLNKNYCTVEDTKYLRFFPQEWHALPQHHDF